MKKHASPSIEEVEVEQIKEKKIKLSEKKVFGKIRIKNGLFGEISALFKISYKRSP